MLDNKNNKYYGVDSGCGSPQNWGNLQSAYSLRSHQSWWTSKGVKSAVLGLGLATLLPLTNAFAADPVDVTISGWNPGNAIHIPYGTDLTDRNTYLRNAVGAYNVTVKAGDKTLKLGTESDPQDGIVKFNVEHLQRYGASSSPVDKVWLEFIPTDRTKYNPASTKDSQAYDLYVDKINVTFAGRDYPDYTRDSAGNYDGKSLKWTVSKASIGYGQKLESVLNKSIQKPKDAWTGRELDGKFKFYANGREVNEDTSDLDAGTYTLTATFTPEYHTNPNRYDPDNYLTGTTDYPVNAPDWDNLSYTATHPYATPLTLTVNAADGKSLFKLTAADLKEIEYGTWLKDLIIKKAQEKVSSDSDKAKLANATYTLELLNNKGEVIGSWTGKDEDGNVKFAMAGKTDGKGMRPVEIPNPDPSDIYGGTDYYNLRKDLPNFQVGNTYSNLRVTFSYPNYSSVPVTFDIKVVKAIPSLYWVNRNPDKDGGFLPEMEVGTEIGDRLALKVKNDPVNGRPLDPRVYETDETEDSENYTLPVVKYTVNGEVIHADWKPSVGDIDYTVVAEYDIGKRNPERDYYFGAAPATISTTAKLHVFAKATPNVDWPIAGKTVEINYGTKLSPANVLNATGTGGTITYTLDANQTIVMDVIPDVGNHVVTMTFMPDDPVHYKQVVLTANLIVNPVRPNLVWSPSFFYGQDSINKMADNDTLRENLETKSSMANAGKKTFRIKYGNDGTEEKALYKYIEGIPDIGDCEFFVIDELDLNGEKDLSTAIQELLDQIKASGLTQRATAFVVAYDFSKGDNIEQYIGCTSANCPEVGKYSVPVHFVAVGLKAYRFLDTLTPEEQPYTGKLTIKPYELLNGIGYGNEGFEKPAEGRVGAWADQGDITIKYGEIIGLVQGATNAFYGEDAFYNDHYLVPWRNAKNELVWDTTRPGNISYEIYSNDGTINYDAAATWDILTGKRALPVHKVYKDGKLDVDNSDYTLVAVFTPFDTKNYVEVRAERRLIVDKQDISVAWVPKEYIFYGEYLSADQLNATFSTSFLGNPNYDMTKSAAIRYYYRKVTDTDEAKNWHEVSLMTARLIELGVVVKDDYDYVLKVVYTPQGDDANNYNAPTGSDIERDFMVHPAELTVQPTNLNLTIGTKRPKDLPYEIYNLQFNDAKVCPKAELATNPATAPEQVLSQNDYEVYVANESAFTTSTKTWNALNYHYTFLTGHIYVGKNPIIEWGTPADAVVDETYGNRLDAKAYNPADPTAELDGTWVYTYAGKEIFPDTAISTDVEHHKGPLGARTLYATFTPDDTTYLPSTSQVTLWVKERPVLGWPDADNTPIEECKATTPYGVKVTESQIKGWASVVRWTDDKVSIKDKGTVTYKWDNKDDNPEKKDDKVVGKYGLTLYFTPSDANKKEFADAKALHVYVTVVKANPTWATWTPLPNPITYGTRLSDETHLNAKVNGPARLMKDGKAQGHIDYTVNNPPNAGKNVLIAVFTPDDTHNFNKSTNTAELMVDKAGLKVDWTISDGDDRVKKFTYGTSVLDPDLYAIVTPGKSTNGDDLAPVSVTLNLKTVRLDGTRLYKDDGTPVDHPADIPNAGDHTLTATVDPADAANFEPLPKERKLHVNPQTPSLGAWSGTKTIEFGTLFDPKWFTLTGKVLDQTVDVEHSGWNYTVKAWRYTNRDKGEGGYQTIAINPETELLDYNVDAADAGVNPAYKVVVSATPTSSNYTKGTTTELGLNVEPTRKMEIYPLNEEGDIIEGKPIERFWNHNGVDFTAMVRTLSEVKHPAEKGRVLEGTYRMVLTPVDVELSADATANTSTSKGKHYDPATGTYVISWTTRANDESTKAAKKITDVPSGKYHIAVTFNPWGYRNPRSSKNPYASKDYNTSDYVGPYTRETNVQDPADVFLLYIDPAVYIKTAWDSEGEGYSADPNPDNDPFPYLERLVNPLNISYPYAESAKHTYDVSKLGQQPIDAEYYARELGIAVVEGTWSPMTWTVNGVEQETVPTKIANLEPGKYTLTLTFTASWDEYRHYFDGQWIKTINFDVYQIDPVASWDPEPTYYAEPDFYTEPGAAQRNGVADVPGTFYYPGADMSKTGIDKKLWPSTSWPNWVKRDEDGNVVGHTVYATFQPKDTVTYKTIRVEGYLVVNPEEVQTIWEPAPMNYGDEPGLAQFNAMAIPVHNGAVLLNDKYGTFDYPTTNWPKEAGQHTVVAIFNPIDPNNYVDYYMNPGHNGDYPIRATGLLTINSVEAPFEWNPKPLTMPVDQSFMKSQLSGAVKKKVSGTTEFYCDDIRVFEDSKTPEQLGIPVGPNHELKAVFKPTSGDYKESTKVVNLAITDGKITIEWTPAPTIGYTTPLDTENYLNAKAYRNGESLPDDGFTYTPAAGTTAQQAQIKAGAEWELTATYTLEGEKPVEATRFITVEPAKLVVDFIESEVTTEYGQLITEEIAGVVVTDTATGEPFYDGVFTYAVAVINEDGTVGPVATKTVESCDPETGETVEVTVNVDPSVDVLPVGMYALIATFTPNDEETYGEPVTTETPATLTVIQTEPVVTMTDPVRLPYGVLFEDALDKLWTYTAENKWNDTLEVEAESLEFTFVNAEGDIFTEKDEPLPVGIYTVTMTFNPVDTHNYTTGTATAQLTIGRATPVISWYPEPIEFPYGAELPESVLTAKAINNIDGSEVEGYFDYLLNGKPVEMGALLVNMLGVQELTAQFNPANTNSYTSPRETVELHVYEGSLTPVTVRADDKIITFGQTAELTYTVDPKDAATATLSTTYKGEFVGVYDITVDTVTPKDATYAIDNPIPGRLTVNPATPTVEFYELLTEDEEESVSEEPLQTIPLIYGDVMEFDTENAIITITNPNKDDDAEDDDDDDSEVESASDITVGDSADDDEGDDEGDEDEDSEPVVVRTIKVVVKDINGKEMKPETVAFTLDAEQPLEPQDEAYTLTVALTYGNGNYADGSVTIPVTVTADEDALDVEWPIPSHDFTWIEGNSWAEYGFEKNAEATVYGTTVAEGDDLVYLMAKLPADVEIPEDVDPEDLDLEDFGLTPVDLDLAEFDPEAIVAEAGVYYLAALYADTLYGVDMDEDIVLFVAPAPIPVVEVKVETITYEGMVAGDDVRKFVNYTVTSIAPVDGTFEYYEVEGIDNDYIGKIYANENEQTLPAGKYKVTAEFTLAPVVGVKYDVTTVPAELDVAEYVPPIPVVNVTVTTIAKEGMTTGEPASKYLDAVVEPEVDGDIYYHVTGNNIDLVVDIDDAVTTLPVGNYDVTAVFTPAPVVGVDYVITETSATLTVADVPLIPVKLTAGVIQNPIVYGQKYVGDIYFTAVDVNGAGVAGKASWTVIDKKTGEVVSTFNPPALPDVEILNAGDYTLTVDFTPDSSAYAKPADASVDLTVEQAFVDVAAHTAQGMVAGDNVSNYILPYTTTPEGVTGQPVYGVYDENEELVIEVDPEEDKYQTLPAGIYTVEPMIFVPDSDNYRFGQPESATLTVEAPAPVYVVEWNVPETIVYGTTIALNATVTKDGEPVLDPVIEYYLDNEETPLLEGWILDVDSYSVIAVYAETGDKCVKPVTVTPKDLDVTMDGAEVVYGELLTKLPEVKIEGLLEGDTVEYDVTSIYHAGTTPAGTYKDGIIATLVVGSDNYTAPEQVTSPLTVKKATQEVLLVVNPTVLNVDESATATVVTTSGLPATIAISDTSILSQNLVALKVGTVTVIAKQAGDNNYEPAESDPVIVTVAPKADVQITWEPKSPIAYGTILSAEHLNATASLDGQTVEGHFYYNPTFGYVVTPESRFVVNGKLRLSATFVPTDRKRFKNAYIEVLVDIETEDDTTDDGDEEAPALTISKAGSAKGLVNAAADALVITFTGTLEESTDGVTWTPVVGAEDGTYVVDVKVANQKFYRSVK